MLLHRLLKYYLDSDFFFGVYVDMFFEDIHFGVCGKERYVFKSQIYRGIEDKLNKTPGYELKLSCKKLLKYFTLLKNDYQLSAVIFGEWYGLSKRQLLQVADSRSPDLSWQKINYFLCNPNRKSFPDNYDLKEDMKKITYYIQTDAAVIPARYDIKLIRTCEKEPVKLGILVDQNNNSYIFGTDNYYDAHQNFSDQNIEY